MPSPTYADLTRDPDLLPPYERIVVPSAFEDRNGHMNIAHYLTTTSWGVERAFNAWGIPHDWAEKQGLTTFSAEHHLTYHREVHTGSIVSVRVRAIARSAKSLHVAAYLLDETHELLAYTMELLSLHIDLTSRRTSTWPAPVAAGLDRAVAAHAGLLDWPTSGCLATR